MNSRERILSALAHREPDRVPIDCGAMHCTGMQAIAYNRLKGYLGIDTGPTRVYEVVQQLAEPDWSILDRFRVDALSAGREFSPERWRDWVLPDGSPCQVPDYHDLRREGDDWVAFSRSSTAVARLIAGGTHFSQEHFPLDRPDWPSLMDELPRYLQEVCWMALPEPIWEGGAGAENLQKIAAHVRRLRQTTDKAIMIPFGGNLFEWGCYLRRMDNFLMDLALDPAQAEMLLDKFVEIHLANLDLLLPVLGDNVDLIQLSDDLGTESGPFFSLPMFRRFFKERYRIIASHIKRLNPRMSVFLHCCGSIAPLLDDLIEVGIEVINPVQISAHNMQPEMLKKRFGADITFWGGGCDTQHVLSTGTPAQVKEDVRRNIEVFAPGGGFVFAPVHNVLAEVPPENIVAMYEAAIGG